MQVMIKSQNITQSVKDLKPTLKLMEIKIWLTNENKC